MLQTASPQGQNELLLTLFLLLRLFLLALPPSLGFALACAWQVGGRCFVGESSSSLFNFTFLWGILNH